VKRVRLDALPTAAGWTRHGRGSSQPAGMDIHQSSPHPAMLLLEAPALEGDSEFEPEDYDWRMWLKRTAAGAVSRLCSP
jgi:hypothetical protein